MFRRSKNFLLGLAGLFGIGLHRAVEKIPTPAPSIPKPRPVKNAYRGIEQILECPDHARRVFMLNWGLQNLRNASADTRRKWAKAANQFSWRMDRRPNQHPVAA